MKRIAGDDVNPRREAAGGTPIALAQPAFTAQRDDHRRDAKKATEGR